MANSDYAGASSRGKTLALERYQSYLRDADSGRYKKGMAITAIMQQLGILSESTVYRYLRTKAVKSDRK
ncbi:hypothetical protein HMPREF9137_2010 [Prevotella denticola F0289]|nr:hypothetical protein HMPREF9137_2010 [Prevotella denticola F0289]